MRSRVASYLTRPRRLLTTRARPLALHPRPEVSARPTRLLRGSAAGLHVGRALSCRRHASGTKGKRNEEGRGQCAGVWRFDRLPVCLLCPILMFKVLLSCLICVPVVYVWFTIPLSFFLLPLDVFSLPGVFRQPATRKNAGAGDDFCLPSRFIFLNGASLKTRVNYGKLVGKAAYVLLDS